ncbi:MAG: glycosyltransferase [bacterium]
MAKPTVSVIIPSYNAAAYLPDMLESVFSQTYQDFEVILVDDGSSDNTREVIAPYRERIQYIYQENSGGPTNPRNVGLRRARGRLVTFCDADDILKPSKLADALNIFDSFRRVDVVISDCQCVGPDGEMIRESWLGTYQKYRRDLAPSADPQLNFIAGPDIYRHLLRHNFIGVPGVMVKKSAMLAVGGFDESLPNAEDRDLWLRLGRAGFGFAIHEKIQFIYYKRSSGVTAGGWRLWPALIRVLEKQRPFLRYPADEQFLAHRLRALRLGYAYRLRQNGDYDTALTYIREALAERWSWMGVKAMLLTRLQKVFASS